jgi:hypothetical protein
MKLTNTQRTVFDNLMRVLQRRGRAYTFGWVLGLLIKTAATDPQLRTEIERKAQANDR